MKTKSTPYASFRKDLNGFISALLKEERHIGVVVRNDDFLTKMALDQMRDRLETDVKFEVLYGPDLNQDKLLQIFSGSGLFQSKSLYLIKDADKSKSFDALVKRSIEQTEQNTTVVLEVKKLSEKYRKVFASHAQIFNVNSIESKDHPILIMDLGKHLKLDLSPDSVKFLLEYIGDEPQAIFNELQIISLMNPERINRDFLKKHISFLKKNHVFDLTNHILNHQTSKAVSLIEGLIQRGESPLVINALIWRFLNNSKIIQECQRNSVPLKEQFRFVRLPQFILKSYNKFVASYSVEFFNQRMEQCRKIDVELKTTRLVPSHLFTDWLFTF